MVSGCQWRIFWADLEPVRGSEQAGRRPVLVISAEEANQAIPLLTVLPLTSLKPGRKIYPTETLLKAKATGLSKDSIALAHQIRAITRERLGETCGALDSPELREAVRHIVRRYLDLL